MRLSRQIDGSEGYRSSRRSTQEQLFGTNRKIICTLRVGGVGKTGNVGLWSSVNANNSSLSFELELWHNDQSAVLLFWPRVIKGHPVRPCTERPHLLKIASHPIMSDSVYLPEEVSTMKPATMAQPSHRSHPPKRPSRARDVSPRDLNQSANGYEMVYAILCAIRAHGSVHEHTGQVHGDINPNALILFDREDPRGTALSKGGLIYWEPPINLKTLRNIGRPDPPVPPPRRPQTVMPPFYHHWHI
ncbi:hypothetical protein BD414DRAFT_329487 [Trametes punicea]|nr:hypothetical protein BD414DRAFT_329487 [Trametes punicea]